MFLGRRVLKICSKFTGEYPCRSAISIKLQNKIKDLNYEELFVNCFPGAIDIE